MVAFICYLVESIMAGGKYLCDAATTVTGASFTDSGNTTGAVNDVQNYFSTNFKPFRIGTHDQFYKNHSWSQWLQLFNLQCLLTGSTLDGATF